jgi:hypothetical protein
MRLFSLFLCQDWESAHTNMMRLFLFSLVKTENMRTQIWSAFFSFFLSKLKICAHKHDAPFSLFSSQNWEYAHTNMMRLSLHFLVKTEKMSTQTWCAFFSFFWSKLKICAHMCTLLKYHLTINIAYIVVYIVYIVDHRLYHWLYRQWSFSIDYIGYIVDYIIVYTIVCNIYHWL